MWVSDYCKLCLIHSRCNDLITLGRADQLPKLLKYLSDAVVSMGRSEAFAKSYTYIKSLLNSEDPYLRVKEELKRRAAKVAYDVRKHLLNSGWDLIRALEFSAAANIIDTSVLGYQPKELDDVIWDLPGLKEFWGIPDKKVVLAVDNSGEFEIDLILAEALINNGYDVELAVRGDSYEIDMTYEEVIREVNDKPIKVLRTPNGMPPSIYVNDGFLISKGIANAEAYVEYGSRIESIHLFRAKCDVLPEVLSVPKNSVVIVSGKTLINLSKKFNVG